MAADITDDEILAQVVEKLEAKFPDHPKAEIEKLARDEFAALKDRPVRDFLGVLTERAVKKHLKDQ
jgi:hypothetical protein